MSLTKGIILSLCDVSGVWSRPYIAMGYTVVRVDPKHGEWRDLYGDRGMTDKLCGNGTWNRMDDGGYGLSYSVHLLANVLATTPGYFRAPVVGVLMAPPCTDFSGSGARHWAAKDADGRTRVSISIVKHCLLVKDFADPKWWCCENPVGRIARLVPEVGPLRMTFHPCDYAGFADEPSTEAYTKRTCLFGEFNTALPKAPVEPVYYVGKDGKRSSWIWAKLGGKSERTKALRSTAPTGFSRAFAKANP